MPKLDWKAGVPQFRYTIGELIDMLPKNDFTLEFEDGEWCVECRYCFYDGVGSELIDALYEMIIHLKEEGKL